MGRADECYLVPRIITATTHLLSTHCMLGTALNTLQDVLHPVFLRPRKVDILIPIFQMRQPRSREMKFSHQRSHSQEVTSLEAKLPPTIVLWTLGIYWLT